jgi:hypothetical protein
MAVLVGSARIDENGNTHGGAAGDQTGKEVCMQNWYLHSKGWVLLRPLEEYAEKIASAMENACANDNIGYDQYQRLTLYNNVKDNGFDTSKVATKVETDCSALVRVCCAYAGITVANFTTANEATTLVATKKFTKYTDSKYTQSSNYLKRGDILVTKTTGHTVVVLSNGSNVTNSTSNTEGFDMSKLSEIKSGSTGGQVKALQILLNGKMNSGLSVDGECGTKTVSAIKKYQSNNNLTSDGICGAKTWAKILGVN